jgi:thiol:disulfide interchange protein DsbD
MRRAAAALALFGAVSRLEAAPLPSPADLLRLEPVLTPSAEQGRGILEVKARLAPGWHVNSHKPSEDYLIPTAVSLDATPALTAGDARYPEGRLVKFSFSDKPLSVYEESFVVEVPVTWTGGPPEALSGKVEFQACNDKQCLAPASVSFRARLGSGAPAPQPAAAPLSGGAVPLSQAPPAGAAAGPAATRDFGALLETRGLIVVLPLLFLLGLALNATPCVLPVIPLTIAFFVNQAPSNRRRAFGLATVYVLGMATMYSALGVFAGLTGRLFGAVLQSPWAIVGIAVVLLALAFSMFGYYDIQPPSFLLQKAGARAGVAGAYGMGLFVGVIAAPCVGPAVVALLTFVAARQDAFLGFLLFFALSLGLGLPYFFLGAFVPRPGAWMDEVKKAFGWVLVATAAYFVRDLVSEPARSWLLPAALVVGAAATLARAASRKLAIPFVAAGILGAAAFFFAPRSGSSEAGPDWKPYEAARVESAGRPAVVDFAAAWCIPCRELDEKTFSDKRVRAALSKRALFKADMTRTSSPEVEALARRYAILGVPTVIFLDGSGKERSDLRLVGFEDADAFLKRLERAP